MAGWSRQKRLAYEKGYYEFVTNLFIQSKDLGRIALGPNLFWGQKQFITTVFDALEADKHDVYCLKSRQLGASTGSRALTIFLAGIMPGIKGGIVFDSDVSKQEARAELVAMIGDLPKSVDFPKIVQDNRQGLTLANGSRVAFFSAGISKRKGSGTLGRSFGLSLSHASELCSYDNEEGLEAYKQSLSDQNPNRLYIWESTGRGFNQWHDMWIEARRDTDHCACLFLGWWSKDSQRIDQSEPDFERYGTQAPTPRELRRIEEVRDRYGFQITAEQLAWVRRKMDPAAEADGGVEIEYEGNVIRLAEQAWTEEDAFQYTGSVFFAPEKLTEQANKHASKRFKSYMFTTGLEFVDTKVFPAPNTRSVELKVWEEPKADAVYVLSADVAHGSNESNDRSAFQVLRCYADGIDQVAEYAWPLIGTRPYAWVILAVAGWYCEQGADIYLIIELNGPGTAVWDEITYLKHHIAMGYQPREVMERGLKNIFRNVKNYIYSRPDSLAAGKALQWKCLALDTMIPTSSGWTTMGHLDIGDRVLDDLGNVCAVTGLSPVHYGRECYRITFDDGSSVVSDADHLWEVSEREKRKKTGGAKLRITKVLDPSRHVVRVCKPLELPYRELPIDPYVLGVWLGDGAAASGRYYAHKDDIGEMAEHLSATGVSLSPVIMDRGNVRSQSIKGLVTTLREENLLGNKHIPPSYLRASYRQRLSLLQGLMDTDGTADRLGGQCSFSTSDTVLAKGYAELLRTLGVKPKYTERRRTVQYRGQVVPCRLAYQFYFTPYPEMMPFRLRRKASKIRDVEIRQEGKSKFHKIVSVERVDSVPVACVSVDSPSKLYLVGEGMVPTHNTNSGAGPSGKVRLMERFRDFFDNGMFHVRSYDLLEEMKRITRDGDTIGAEGRNKDDRVISGALGVRCWEERVRKAMASQKRTRDYEAAKLVATVQDQTAMFQSHMLENFFTIKRAQRRAEARVMNRARWRYK